MESLKRNLIKKTLSTPPMLESIRQWLTEKTGSTLWSFAKFVCEKCDFTNVHGEPQINTCAASLKALEAQGHIVLQGHLSYMPTARKGYSLSYLDEAVPDPVGVPNSVEDIKELRLIRVTEEQDTRIWKTLIRDEHYLDAFLPPGRRMCYLITSEYGILGALSFSSAANRVKARDEWIMWTDEERQQQLDSVVNMSRFLIRKCVHCRNLASKVLAMSLRAVSRDFLEVYKYSPLLVETFVDSEKYAGTCYKAAGWEYIGITQGRGWNDTSNTALLPRKHIFMKPLVEDFRKQLTITPKSTAPDWVLAGPLSLSEVTQPTWARTEFALSDLGHKARTTRLIKSAEKIASSPHFSTNSAFEGDPAAEKGLYRLIDSPYEEVSFSSMISGSKKSTYRRMMSEKLVLLLQDDTSLNYTSKPETKGLGPISKNQTGAVSQGFLLHTTLAVTPQGVPLGIANATCYARSPKKTLRQGKAKPVPLEKRESFNWIEHAREVNEIGKQMPTTKLITICDRAADMAALFYECTEMPNCDLIVRARADRRIPGEKHSLFELMADTEESGTLLVDVDRQSARPKLSGKAAVKKRDARTATLSIIYRRVLLAPPPERKGQKPIGVYAITAVERKPPQGQRRVLWHLLTTLSINSYEDAIQCIKYYTKRWIIEEFHRVLKTGCRVEEMQYGDLSRLERMLGLYMVMAWRIMLMCKLAREDPDLPAETMLSDIEVTVLKEFFKGKNARPLTNIYSAIVLISKLGGYLDRRADPPPGHQVFWIGYMLFQSMCKGAKLFISKINQSE